MISWFSFKLEKQFIWFIGILLILHLPSKHNGWSGENAWLITIPVLFALANLSSFIIKGFHQSIWELKYLLVVFLYLVIPLKVEFSYYNFLFCMLLLAISIYVLIRNNFKVERLRRRITLLAIINFGVLITPDIYVLKHILSESETSWDERLDWSCFQGSVPSYMGDTGAVIYSTFYWKYNKAFNFPKFISLAVMDKSSSWVKPEYSHYEGNLLNHEQLHFDITEWTRREFQDSLYKVEDINYEKIDYIYWHFRDLEDQRQIEYDSVSQHGLDYIGQILWNKKVREMLR